MLRDYGLSESFSRGKKNYFKICKSASLTGFVYQICVCIIVTVCFWFCSLLFCPFEWSRVGIDRLSVGWKRQICEKITFFSYNYTLVSSSCSCTSYTLWWSIYIGLFCTFLTTWPRPICPRRPISFHFTARLSPKWSAGLGGGEAYELD